jgi:hypothetical protein
MIIYNNSTEQFREDVLYNRIADIMNDAFVPGFGHKVQPSELLSFQNSLSRVRDLLTRGMKGCYVYFTDKGTEGFFRSRME